MTSPGIGHNTECFLESDPLERSFTENHLIPITFQPDKIHPLANLRIRKQPLEGQQEGQQEGLSGKQKFRHEVDMARKGASRHLTERRVGGGKAA